MSDDEKKKENSVTKEWCAEVRHACANQLKERYDNMKELFQLKLKGISEQLEITLQDLQKSLSAGSRRMQDLENKIAEVREKFQDEAKQARDHVDGACASVQDKIQELRNGFNSQLGDLEKEIQEAQKPNWAMWSIIVIIVLSVAAEMLASWKYQGVLEERVNNLVITAQKHWKEDGDEFKAVEKRLDLIEQTQVQMELHDHPSTIPHTHKPSEIKP